MWSGQNCLIRHTGNTEFINVFTRNYKMYIATYSVSTQTVKYQNIFHIFRKIYSSFESHIFRLRCLIQPLCIIVNLGLCFWPT